MTVRQLIRSRFTKALISLLMVVQLAACGGGGGGGGSPAATSNPVVTSSPVVTSNPVVPGNGGPSPVVTGSATLNWSAPVTRADGSPLSLANIEGYRVYYGTSTGSYPNTVDINDGTAVRYTLNNLPAGTYFLVMTTYDGAGRESVFSPEVIKTI